MIAYARLHDGTVGGIATRVLAVLIGLVPTFLFATASSIA